MNPKREHPYVPTGDSGWGGNARHVPQMYSIFIFIFIFIYIYRERESRTPALPADLAFMSRGNLRQILL